MEDEKKINGMLKIISEKLEGISYAFIGSVSLYVQGLKVIPKDIDILTTLEEIKKIDKILEKYRTKEIYFDESEGRNSFRSFYEIDGVEIEILGNVNNVCRRPGELGEKIYVEFSGAALPCTPLNNELDAYKKMGRADKVEIIEEFLRQ